MTFPIIPLASGQLNEIDDNNVVVLKKFPDFFLLLGSSRWCRQVKLVVNYVAFATAERYLIKTHQPVVQLLPNMLING
jgi:hypothetical protein